jgi:hypothetical protein
MKLGSLPQWMLAVGILMSLVYLTGCSDDDDECGNDSPTPFNSLFGR